ncbi:MAG: tRNA (N(6)-L-threonylcarbamoyladenosine(37)-C(2))-methylthiotransferase MtaB [Candidatus Krumholzibacteria bacterium]|nr:tRNA (N(6)-L-threonylcarbamoyladenosine(37)-C(2))-methylthiotransferase MtaB [Candidatus Krumholzibacteria bacterium]
MGREGERAGSFSITTLGCKLNQYESECIRQFLVGHGWEHRPFGELADFYIINTCTVTGRTDARCRNAVRRARRASPGTTIIVTGCYAETQPEALAAMRETDIVLGNREKFSIARVMEQRIGHGNGAGMCDGPIEEFLGHSRAFIKIQEGCDASCSYCIIPRARGPSRSVLPGDVVSQVSRLESNGLEEIVLTGIHIGRYGRDLDAGTDLESLILRILAQTKRVRLRLSSIEVNEIGDGLIDLTAGEERVAAHLHVPLQSGDDEILRAMNRPYDSSRFADRIWRIREASGRIAVGTDIIVGFPGETEERFRSTLRVASELPLTYFHVFPFSPRPGTPAAGMRNQVDPETKHRRSRSLISLGRAKRLSFMRDRIGSRELALIQPPQRGRSRFSTALTGNYCEVLVPADESLSGRLVPVLPTHYSRGNLYGYVASGGTREVGA